MSPNRLPGERRDEKDAHKSLNSIHLVTTAKRRLFAEQSTGRYQTDVLQTSLGDDADMCEGECLYVTQGSIEHAGLDVPAFLYWGMAYPKLAGGPLRMTRTLGSRQRSCQDGDEMPDDCSSGRAPDPASPSLTIHPTLLLSTPPIIIWVHLDLCQALGREGNGSGR